jgi:hypothetical protein
LQQLLIIVLVLSKKKKQNKQNKQKKTKNNNNNNNNISEGTQRCSPKNGVPLWVLTIYTNTNIREEGRKDGSLDKPLIRRLKRTAVRRDRFGFKPTNNQQRSAFAAVFVGE